ncbi:MAG TPA: winged helix-turn-helix domain-containing protein [Myxococcota bacterium]|nr:winged helix-turn-helix domain-containing protein [Myxococcota bacterium]
MLELWDRQVDLQRRLVLPGGARLTPLEARLLAFLAERPGRAFDSRELLAAVWGYRVSSSNTVKTTVSRLRKKIEEDPRQPRHLLFQRGLGYCFEAASEPQHRAVERRAAELAAATLGPGLKDALAELAEMEEQLWAAAEALGGPDSVLQALRQLLGNQERYEDAVELQRRFDTPKTRLTVAEALKVLGRVEEARLMVRDVDGPAALKLRAYMAWEAGELEEATRLVEAALQGTERPGARSRLLANLAQIRRHTGTPVAEVLPLFDEALEQAMASGSPRPLAFALSTPWGRPAWTRRGCSGRDGCSSGRARSPMSRV